MNVDTDNMKRSVTKFCGARASPTHPALDCGSEGTHRSLAGLLGKAKDLDLNVVGVSFHVGSGATNPGETLGCCATILQCDHLTDP